jgi:hypothetical protein
MMRHVFQSNLSCSHVSDRVRFMQKKNWLIDHLVGAYLQAF